MEKCPHQKYPMCTECYDVEKYKELRSAIDDLSEWKRSALVVLTDHGTLLQEDLRGIGRLGESLRDVVMRMKLQLDEAKREATNHAMKRHDAEARYELVCEDLDAAKRLISAWQEYAAFLGVEVGNLALFASTHGWKCPPETAAKGSELRRKLGVNDDWTLVEKR